MATVGGSITSDGGSDIIECGICWGKSANPDVSAYVSTATTGSDSFSCILTNLQPATTYYARAYASNSVGVSYGAQVSFTTLPESGGETPADPEIFTIEVSADPSEAGAVSGGGTILEGETCIVKATANIDYIFVNWTENDTVVSNKANYMFTVTGNRILVAHFIVRPPAPTGAIDGLFTINEFADQLYFSQGNLQYIGSASTPYWQFAENQWDCLGETTGQNGISSIVDRDLFGWGTSGYHNSSDAYNVNYRPWSTANMEVITSFNYFGYGPSTFSASPDLTGSSANYDWGVFNPVSNGGDQIGRWRTLTYDEWQYVLFTRSASTINGVENARYAKANVADVDGVILFPDYYMHPSEVALPVGINGTDNTGWEGNNYSADGFALMQSAGAVFLPAAGYRDRTSVYYVGSSGHYWSASHSGSGYAYSLYFNDNLLETNYNGRYFGLSVRLVRPVIANDR